jgi:oligopeptide transport system permease protein
MKYLVRLSWLWMILVLALSFFIGLFMSESVTQTNISAVLAVPNWSQPFGTDSLGRSLFLRTFDAAKLSLGLGFVSSFLAVLFGAVIGGWAAIKQNSYGNLILRAVEIYASLPNLVLMAVLFVFLNSVFPNISVPLVLAVTVALATWPSFARITRNALTQELAKPYIEAARSVGAGSSRILFFHLWPNFKPVLLLTWGLQLPNFLLFEGALSFLGFGVQPPEASWGLLMQEGWKTLSSHPHLMLFPAVVLWLTVFSANLIVNRYRKLD